MRRILGILLIAAPLRAQVLRAPGLDAVVSAPSAAAPFAANVAAAAVPALAPSLTAAPIADLLAAAPVPAAAAASAAVPAAPAAAPAAAAALPALRGAAAWTPPARPAGGESLRSEAGTPFENWLTRAPAAPAEPAAFLETLRRVRLAPDIARPRTPAPTPPVPRAPEPRPFFVRHYQALRFFVAPLLRLIYRIDATGREHLPAGPFLLVSNHVTYMDPILLSFAVGRPVRFIMYRELYETRGLQWLFRALGAMPISGKDPKWVTEATLSRARRLLASGQSVAIFPEGHLTKDGRLDAFRRGFRRIALDGVPVIPAGVSGMWGSAFSHAPGSSFARALSARLRGRRPVTVRLGAALAQIEPGDAQDAVARLLDAPR